MWDPEQGEPSEDALRDTDAVVHLAGENVAQRWTRDAKQRIRESREIGTRRLVCALARLPKRPSALVCASAIGYYGSRGDEDSHRVVRAGRRIPARGMHGLGAGGGGGRSPGNTRGPRAHRHPARSARRRAPAHAAAFRLGLGGRLGDGRQWMSWIHRDDLAELFRFAVEKPIRGALNAVAPNPLPNAVFTRELARAVRRPAVFPAPQFALRWMFGEMSEVLLASQRVARTPPPPPGSSSASRISARPWRISDFVNRVALTGPKGARPA